MKTRKLIYVLNHYAESDASHFRHVIHLLQVLAERGVQVALVIEKPVDLPGFPDGGVRVIGLHGSFIFIRHWRLFMVLRQLISQGYEKCFVRISAPAALVAALARRLYGGEVYLWQSGTTIEYDLAQPLSMSKAVWLLQSYLPNRLARKLVDWFVTGPESMADYYADVAGVSRDKILILYNDIDTERFVQPADAKSLRSEFLAFYEFDENCRIILMVHRYSPVRKTTMYFPTCLLRLQDSGLLDGAAIIVIGSGDDLPKMQIAAQKLKISHRCIFLGSVPNSQIERYYAISDIFLHPTAAEGFPRVVLEAMASGLPMVSTDAGGTAELVGPGQASFVLDRYKPARFGEALLRLYLDEEKQAEIGQENRQHVLRYSTENVAAMYERALFHV